jgi:hypothetical protein
MVPDGDQMGKRWNKPKPTKLDRGRCTSVSIPSRIAVLSADQAPTAMTIS